MILGQMIEVAAKVVHLHPGSKPLFDLQFDLTDETKKDEEYHSSNEPLGSGSSTKAFVASFDKTR